jgi:hypothetical protein
VAATGGREPCQEWGIARSAPRSENEIMENDLGTVTVWQSGRLAPHALAPRFDLSQVTREQWLIAALSLASAVVMSAYIAVLERDVSAGEMEHMAQRSRAVAEAQCEAREPAESRGRCIALFNGDVVALEPAPAAPSPAPAEVAYEQENAARAMTVSLVGR